MKYLSVCSGIEAASVAWTPIGWTPAAFSEIEPFPCALLKHHYPDVPNLGDMTKFKEWPTRDELSIDLLCGGTPCFPAGTMIARQDGFARIEDIRVGDSVLTHQGRFRRVLRVGHKTAPTVCVVGQGHDGFITTANHPFLARRKTSRGTRIDGKSVRINEISEPEFIRADALTGAHWWCMAAWPNIGVPHIAAVGREHAVNVPLTDLMRLAGAYLGDGWTRINERRGYVMFGITEQKLERLRATFDALGAWSTSKERTTLRVQLNSRPLARWLATHFGDSAAQKKVPMWALGMRDDARHALIAGYLATDGHSYADGSGGSAGKAHGLGIGKDTDPMYTLTKGDKHAIAIQGTMINRSETAGPAGSGIDESGISFTLTKNDRHAVQTAMQVRRLTPEECEALQGFPRGYTQVPNRNKPAADGPRYKALGNSWAVPCARWIGERIDAVNLIIETTKEAA
jgi:site-specific DNA-cytosine methylase